MSEIDAIYGVAQKLAQLDSTVTQALNPLFEMNLTVERLTNAVQTATTAKTVGDSTQSLFYERFCALVTALNDIAASLKSIDRQLESAVIHVEASHD